MAGLLTPKQKKVLDFIRQEAVSGRIAPTIREIARRFGFSSTGTVRDYLRALSRKGYLKLHKSRARAMELTGAGAGLPIVGMVSCGKPRFAAEDIEGYLEPDKIFSGADNVFCLRAKGDSMEGAGIIEGDIMLVRRQSSAESGDIVVALIGDEATVKFLRKKKKGYYLEPANSKYPALAFNETTAVIGRVISVVRKYV